jgi:hypothetical protein
MKPASRDLHTAMRACASSALVVCVLGPLSPERAYAWESECRAAGAFADYEAGICAAEDSDLCEGGLAFAHGDQHGEHGYIAREALRTAGLSALAGPVVLRYWGTTSTVATGSGTNLPSLAPAAFGGASRRIERTIALPWIAQVPDGAHSLGDYAFGNEHCAVDGLPRTDAAGVSACHTFSTHMGLVNSTHFLPQARDVYVRYHDIAASTMMRCADLARRLAMVTHPWVTENRVAMVAECEREALAIEAFGSHFLADAWSSGHMWERWGTPLPSTSSQGRFDQATVALVSGMIHGWRSVVRQYPGSSSLGFGHDRLCLAGPGDDEPIDAVQWLQPGQVAAGGGGDLYLLPCTAYDESVDFAVSQGATLRREYRRMLACLARGFGEIYDRGPRTVGNRAGTEPMLDSFVRASTGDECWTARVTDRSMMNAWDGTIDLGDPGILGGLVLYAGPVVMGAAHGLTLTQYLHREDRVRIDLARMAVVIAREGEAADASRTTDLADATHPALRSLLGVPRNSERTADIATAPFLERAEQSIWSGVAGARCANDSQCASGEVCDPTATADGPACVAHEVGLVRAFPLAEMPRTCSDRNDDDFDRARTQCRTVGGAACDACVDQLLPFVRNACDFGAHAQAVGAMRHDFDSSCDALHDARAITVEPAAVYLLHRRGELSDARTQLTAYCRAAPEPPVPTGSWVPPSSGPPATATSYPHASGFENMGWCGPISTERWWRWTHDAPVDGHVDRLYVETRTFDDLPRVFPADRIALELVAPCTPGGSVVQTGTRLDTNADGTSDAIELIITPPPGGGEICLRLRSLDPDAPLVGGLSLVH